MCCNCIIIMLFCVYIKKYICACSCLCGWMCRNSRLILAVFTQALSILLWERGFSYLTGAHRVGLNCQWAPRIHLVPPHKYRDSKCVSLCWVGMFYGCYFFFCRFCRLREDLHACVANTSQDELIPPMQNIVVYT